ncbi:NAD(P)H-binding protein [Swingsia samuiensis]|uniref:NAD-dependent epimerase/dehydratase family protein n=1 Tax=Swingsia samuiensis TaxID=1293412 RepID=A0A4Y6UPS4_9PROT|nr:NAD-dependent epimerase/dehydratase family protein [Swingsia samuiensis]
MNICVIGANGRSGAALCRALIQRNLNVIAVVRSCGKLAPDLADACKAVRQADLTDAENLPIALENADLVINTAHAKYIPNILKATQAPVVALGSTRKFTRWMDDHGRGVLKGEQALIQDGRPSVILHPTMIYGAQGEDNVQRLATLLERLPIIPLPGGGKSLVQPIYQSDVTNSMIAAIDLIAKGRIKTPESIVIAGPKAVSYRTFVRMILYFAEMGGRPIISVPGWMLSAAAHLIQHMNKLPKITPEEVRRLLEDKNFDITRMENELGVKPVPLEYGLKKLLARPYLPPV